MTTLDILLCAFNARYQHTAFGLMCLQANLKDLKPHSQLFETTINNIPRAIVEEILDLQPKIISLSVYIWNIEIITIVADMLKTLRPDIILIAGGPEISYEWQNKQLSQMLDYIITGEGEYEFYNLCKKIKNDNYQKPQKLTVINAKPIDTNNYTFAYNQYTDLDIANRFIYVEASRGCPFSCQYCMSSLDNGVRYFKQISLFAEFDKLLERGAKCFKFIDRSFNINIPFALEVIKFFLNCPQQVFLHFELIPDNIPEPLIKLLKICPKGMIQFEMGIQTFNPEVAKRIKRPLNIKTISENIIKLNKETEVHIHADLIAGLPGETINSFAKGFNMLLQLSPHEIQLGILKRLSGAPIAQHSKQWDMRYSNNPPYEIIQNSTMSFKQLQELQRFARFWNLTVNNGNFKTCAPLIWHRQPSAFMAFSQWSAWLYQQTNSTGNIALNRLAQLLFTFLTDIKNIPASQCAIALLQDFKTVGRCKIPTFLRAHIKNPNDVSIINASNCQIKTKSNVLKRQTIGT